MAGTLAAGIPAVERRRRVLIASVLSIVHCTLRDLSREWLNLRTMLELIFLLIVIPKRMTRLARERNRSALKWSLAAIGVWVGTEVVVIFGLGLLVFLSWYFWRTPRDPQKVTEMMYIPGLIAALISAEFMIRRLRARPPLPDKPVAETSDLQPPPA